MALVALVWRFVNALDTQYFAEITPFYTKLTRFISVGAVS